jgi:hypothetical protein
VLNSHISFAANEDIGIPIVQVGEEIQSKDYAAV